MWRPRDLAQTGSCCTAKLSHTILSHVQPTGREADVQLPEPRGRLDGRERAMFRAAERAMRRGPRARTAASRPGRRRSAHHSEQTEDVNAPSCAPPELERSIEHAGIPADPKLERARADRLDQHESPGGRSGCLGVASSQEARGCCSAGAEPWTCDGRPAREVGGMQVAQPGAVARGPRTAHAPRQATQRAASPLPPIRIQIEDPNRRCAGNINRPSERRPGESP